MIRKLLKMRKIKKICKANHYYCPDCIYSKLVPDKNWLRITFGCKLRGENDGKT